MSGLPVGRSRMDRPRARRVHGWAIAFASALVGTLATASPVHGQVLSGSLLFTSVQPCRVFDTRHAVAGQMGANTTRTFHVVGGSNDFAAQGGQSGGCDVPGFAAGVARVKAVMLNFVAVQPQGYGWLTIWPTDQPLPLASTLNYTAVASLDIANGIAMPVRQDSEGGDITVQAASSATHVLADVVGYFTEPTGPLTVRGVNWASHEVTLQGRTGALAGASLEWDSTPTTGGRSYSLISTGSGAGAGSGKFALWDNTSNVYRLLVEADGDVVIGTTASSSSRLLVSAPGANGIAIEGNNTGDTRLRISNGGGIHYLFDDDSEDHDLKLESAADTDLVFNTGGPNERLRILSEGSVCVGVSGGCDSNDLLVRASSVGGNAFAIRNTSDAEVLYISGTGRIVANSLNLADFSGGGAVGHLCKDFVGNVVDCSSAAEYVPVDAAGPTLPEAGELVSILPELGNPWQDRHGPFVVARTERACDPQLLGFLSDPALGASGKRLNENYLPLAIYGYFPAKVTMEGGPIRRGDPITSSSTPGKGMKSTGACRIVGYALEDADRDGTIQLFAWSGESAAPHVDRLEREVEALRERNDALEEQVAALRARHQDTEATLAGLAARLDRVDSGPVEVAASPRKR